jgi:hypothetical protein
MRLAVSSSATIITLLALTVTFTFSSSMRKTILSRTLSSRIGALITGTSTGDAVILNSAIITPSKTTTTPTEIIRCCIDHPAHKAAALVINFLRNSFISPPENILSCIY